MNKKMTDKMDFKAAEHWLLGFIDAWKLQNNRRVVPHIETIQTALIRADRLHSGDVSDELWFKMESAPKDGTSFYVQEYYKVPFKWKPYSPKSQQFKRGIKGRWQEMNEYGGWENSNKKPTEWQPHPDDAKAMAKQMIKEVEG